MQQFVAITVKQFANKSWIRNAHYGFAAQNSIIPIMATELTKIATVMPLGFVQVKDRYQLVAITSLQPGKNLFVAPDGCWLGEYLPAVLCGYPFRLIKPENHGESVLCIDQSSGLVVDDEGGEPFYDKMGKPSQALQDMLNFHAYFESKRVMTDAAVESLQIENLIEPWQLNMRQDGHLLPVNGLYQVNEMNLNTLDANNLKSLRDKGALAIAYAQLFSMNQIPLLEKLETVRAQYLYSEHGSAGFGSSGLLQGDEIIKFFG